MHPMTALLARITLPKTITPAAFAQLFDDFDFDGNATDQQMQAFLQAALACLQSSNKSIERLNALSRLSALVDVQTSGIFPRLNVQIVLFQLILRVLKPERVNQISFGLCGPAHFAIALIKARPWVYVELACSLLFKGRAYGDDGFEIVPDDYVRNFDP